MITVNALSEVAALMGDPARAAMMQLLMDGRAHTASDLAHAAGVTAQTASGHLGRMVEANLLAARAQGRNRFYRLASGDVAHAMESLMALAGQRAEPASRTAAWRRDPDLRYCRTCYDHLAGQVGLAVTDSLSGFDIPGVPAAVGVKSMVNVQLAPVIRAATFTPTSITDHSNPSSPAPARTASSLARARCPVKNRIRSAIRHDFAAAASKAIPQLIKCLDHKGRLE